MTEPLDIQAFAKALHEILVLACVRDGPRHGYQIALELEERSRGLFVLTHGTLYPILHRLEGAGALRGRWSTEGGRRRKAYSLTPVGRAKLEADAQRCELVLNEILLLARGTDAERPDTDSTHRRGA
jgi:PadR family transcriptional regulator, regulatory protein PadR